MSESGAADAAAEPQSFASTEVPDAAALVSGTASDTRAVPTLQDIAGGSANRTVVRLGASGERHDCHQRCCEEVIHHVQVLLLLTVIDITSNSALHARVHSTRHVASELSGDLGKQKTRIYVVCRIVRITATSSSAQTIAIRMLAHAARRSRSVGVSGKLLTIRWTRALRPRVRCPAKRVERAATVRIL